MKVNAAIVVFVLALSPSLASPEVVDSSANGFNLKTTLMINVAPDEVYRLLVHNIGDWWDSGHTYSGDSHNLTIEDKPMGCFCEKLPNRGSVRHMEVVFLAPGKTLGLTGALGPLQTIAAAGNMRIELSAAPGGTKLDLTYAVIGYTPKGMNTWAAPVDSVLSAQFVRLKAYAEGGDKALKPPLK
jgi:hypothetical protein